MRKSSTLKAGALLCIVTIVGVGLWPDDAGLDQTRAITLGTTSVNLPDKGASKLPEPDKKSLPGVRKTEEGMDFDPEMKERLLTISEAYEEHVQYPNFSRPIKADELERKHLPDIPIASELPARLSDPNSPTLVIKSSKMRYFPDDQIGAVASINGLGNDVTSDVSATLVANGKVVSYATVSPLEDQPHRYALNFQSIDTSEFDAKQELTISTEFLFEGSQYQRGTSIEYVRTIASIDQVEPASVQQEYLVIPVYVSTDKPGYHRVQGILYDATNGTPLVHLKDEADLDSSYGTLSLKAHIAALKKSGSEGPYILKDMSLQRLPSAPDYITEFGSVEFSHVDIEGFSFSEYNDQPYVNEKAQRIAKELRRLGS